MRQTYRDFVWLVADELFLERKEDWSGILERVDFPILFINAPIFEGNKRNLCAVYNSAADYVCDDGFDMLISLQDYIYIPEDGLEKFIEVHSDYPDELLTGVTHISRDPYPNKVKNKNSGYSIFEEPYHDKPKRFSWEDVRVTEIYLNNADVFEVETGHWEANWAAVPANILKQGVRWDENYDKGIAYENMDFAQQCKKELGTKVLLDRRNIAISLPHKDYFEGEREDIELFSNREYYESKWLP